MSKVYDGGSAFPEPSNAQCGGMTLRDYFAAKVMQEFIREYHKYEQSPEMHIVAEQSYVMADAMLKARES